MRFDVSSRQVHVDLEDTNHAFRLVLSHDGEHITAIEPEFVRHPFNTCPESKKYLVGLLIGQPLQQVPDIRRALETRSSCTHVTDMTALALSHVGEPGLERLYDIEVDDERDGRARARITCDGLAMHDWIVAAHAVVEPRVFAGQPMMRGFHAWAREAFSGLQREAAFMLQRGYFVAQARRYDSSPEREHPAIRDGMPDGVCYSYSAPVVQRAERIEGSRRDFTDNPEALLRFER
ncbi:DUF2889 domain-containing protein [Steroidobacter denitrificans]|uniref:DUF2889 domain-containing protein n=1 Tax=Steroidobacter denitrificans TaxID=465721 RepID=UPI001438EE07|nr:DUF2889 domain-containing protein [Steroidobacter denitrificans]